MCKNAVLLALVVILNEVKDLFRRQMLLPANAGISMTKPMLKALSHTLQPTA
jgi:hypothetical protein